MWIPRQCHTWAKAGAGRYWVPARGSVSAVRLELPYQHFPACSTPSATRGEKIQTCLQLCSHCPDEARKHRSVFFASASPSPHPACHCAHMVSVFLSHSQTQAIIHYKHTSEYQHKVGCTGFINFLLLGNGLPRISKGKNKTAADCPLHVVNPLFL